MKKVAACMLVVVVMACSCASPKPYYETAEGKRKQEYYNDIYYGRHKPFYKHR